MAYICVSFVYGDTSDFNLTIYAFLTMISWLSLLQYLRIFQQLRIFIELLNTSMRDIRWFLIVLFVMFASFTSAFYFRRQTSHNSETQKNVFNLLIMEYQLLYGEFADESHQLFTDWVLFVLCSFFITLLMMNLLIAIISDTYERVMESIEKSQYA